MNLTAGTTNSWTKPTSGNWEEPYWSLGVLPFMDQDAIEFRNPGWKALAVAPSTTANFPGSLAIQRLTVDAPVDSSNLLLLNYAGLNVPLDVKYDFVLGPNGSLISYYSSLHATVLSLNGPASFSEQSTASFDAINLGRLAPAELNISNAIVSAQGVTMGSTGLTTVTTINLNGGTMMSQDIQMLASSVFNISGGVLETTNLEVGAYVGSGTAEFKSHGGSIRARNVLRVGLANPTAGGLVGNFFLADGDLEAGTNEVNRGRFLQTGGTNLVQAMYIPRNDGTDRAEYLLLGGFLGTKQLELGNYSFFGSGGSLIQSNGVHANSDYIQLWAIDRTGAHTIKGRYNLAGGLFTCPHIQVMGGEFTQNGGTNQTANLDITQDGSYYMNGGFLTASNLGVRSSDVRGFYSFYYHQGGSTTVPRTFNLSSGGSFTIQLGTFTAPEIVVGVGENSLFERGRPIFAMQGSGAIANSSFTLSGGNMSARSHHELGKLVLGSGNSVLTFDESGTVVRFLDSHTAGWSGTLRIANWAGSTNGGGAHQLFFGTSAQGLTASQLSHIYFFRPAGLPDGNYLARILPTGEVVPVEMQPSVSYTRSSNQLVLSWPAGYQLYSSPTVDGPYAPVPGATSPYTVEFSEQQRYFQLRPGQ